MIIDEYLGKIAKEKSIETEFTKCNVDIDVDKMRMVIINEAMPNNMEHYFYSTNHEAEYALSGVSIFQRAGVDIKQVSEILDRGIYITSAVKCPKKAVNLITKRNTKKYVIPSMSTYKIRHDNFFYKDIQVIPSYIMTGPNLLLEKNKMNMIVELRMLIFITYFLWYRSLWIKKIEFINIDRYFFAEF